MLQVVIATTKRAAWRDSPRGLGAADLAMHVVLPELDGRVLAGAIAFKDPLPPQDGLAFTAFANRPEPDRIAFVADRVAALVRLQQTPRVERRIAVLMPDYPGAPGRTGYAVGLDVPASVVALLADLAEAGYGVAGRSAKSAQTLLEALKPGRPRRQFRSRTTGDCSPRFPPRSPRASMRPGASPRPIPMCATARSASAPPRSATCWSRCRPIAGGRSDRRADYHDPTLPPRHALLAFGLWLRHVARGRRHRAHGRAWHARMAAGQGGGADRVLLPRSGRRRRCR